MADEDKKPLAEAEEDESPADPPAAESPADPPAEPAAPDPEAKKEESGAKEAKKSKGDDDDQIWLVMQSRSQGRPYYYHTKSKETVWEKPADFEEDLPEGEDGWVEMESRTQGRYYFYNKESRECTWDRPAGVPEPVPFERRRPNPKRDALQQIITDWADEFYKEHGREPTEEDIPQGSDISRHHRDCKMLKREEEVERLKKEQARLRQELSPDSRERLITIKKELSTKEDDVVEWKKKKDEERARREKVTTTYNSWIKGFTEEHGRGPTEKDIAPDSEISEMFKEYSVYREETRRAKQRAARIEEKQKRSRQEDDHRKLQAYMSAFHKKYGRYPSEKDLPKDSEMEKLYRNYLERETGSALRKQISEWSHKFEKEHGRKPTRSDIPPDSEIADVYKRYEALRKKDDRPDKDRGEKERGGSSKPRSSRQPAEGEQRRRRAPMEDDEYAMGSPKSYTQYQRNKPTPGGCVDCCRIS